MRIEVTQGGEPSAEQLAALVVALTPVQVRHAGEGASEPARTPAWARAALLEGAGGRAAVDPGDLQRLERTAGRR